MKTNDTIKHFFIFIVFMALQVLWVKTFVFMNVAFCFIYLTFIIGLPLSIPIPLLLLIGFASGFLTDLFYDTIGIHAAACIVILYLRPNIIMLLTPLGGYDKNTEISIRNMGIRWYFVYTLLMVFIHHFVVFLLEAGGFSYFYWTLLKVIASTFFSTFMIISLQYLFFTSAARNKSTL